MMVAYGTENKHKKHKQVYLHGSPKPGMFTEAADYILLEK
jgi:hypothetical protein